MRKGYILIEILFVIAIFGLIIASMDRFFRVIAIEIPKDNRLVGENVVLLNAARYIKADVIDATALSERKTTIPSLEIQKSGNAVTYRFEDGKISRKDNFGKEITWPVPHSKIEMRIWEKNKKGYAVELITYIEDKEIGHNRKKMANNYVFFAGALPEVVK